MTDEFKKSLKIKEILMLLDEDILVRAMDFYKKGFMPKNLSSSQMAAVHDRIRVAGSFNEARTSVISFLNNQLDKLKKKETRTGEKKSWLHPLHDGSGRSLGDELKDCLEREAYLADLTEAQKAGLDGKARLNVLCRFWGNVYGLYCYENTFGAPMTLHGGDES